jgi:hypothetical protein
MQKRILMIGNTAGLPGVPIDINDYYSFFTSPIGGSWCSDDEIDILLNPTQHELLETIADIQEADYDYLITVFSGHGITVDGETILSINEEGDEIVMSDLTNLSQRQLLIIDCCRSYAQMSIDDAFIDDGATMLSISRDSIRRAYEERIRNSAPQEVILFACDEGEKALEDPDEGGTYSQNLLYAAQTIQEDSDVQFISVNAVHRRAVSLIQRGNSYPRQHPQIHQSQCSIHCRLTLVVNAEFL